MNIEERLEQELDRLIKEQDEVHYLGKNSSEIQLLEKIRGRPYKKCMVCNTDLTLKCCEHHPNIIPKYREGNP